MDFKFLLSCTAFSLLLTTPSFSEESGNLSQEASKEESAQEAKKESSRKKVRAHFAGVKRPEQTTANEKKDKKSSGTKNQWAVSKTYPKTSSSKKETAQEQVSLSSNPASLANGPFIRAVPPELSSPNRELAKIRALELKVNHLESEMEKLKKEEKSPYPPKGFQAPHGLAFFTGEWLFWRTRQEDNEFAVARSSASPGVYTNAVPSRVDFDWQSGFRVGLGVHLPYDGWDMFMEYTNFSPSHTHSVSGSIFPLLLYQNDAPIGNVTQASGHWSISFQTANVQLGRAYHIAKSLVLHPHLGMQGAWIDQNARFSYQGGDIAAGQTYNISSHNDFKGAGIRIGMDSNWGFGAGFSLFGNFAAALIAGHFDVKQTQTQLNGVEAIDLHSDFNLVNPNVEMVAGLAWDINFYRDRCHFGISLGFETDYWWQQNQMERFTDSVQPIYVRAGGDLAFYGISLEARLDF